MSDSEFDLDLDELSSAEDFLSYFEVDFDPSVVHVNRLHILQRFHDYLGTVRNMPEEEEPRRTIYKKMLTRAYQDFLVSNAQTEKVFKVFQTATPGEISVPVMKIGLERSASAS